MIKGMKVKFSPMKIEEEKTIAKYLDGTFRGPWKDWFDKNFSEFLILERNFSAMIQTTLQTYGGWRLTVQLEQVEKECQAAYEYAKPYLHREIDISRFMGE